MRKLKRWRWREWSFAYKLTIIYMPLIVLPSVIGLSVLTNTYNQTLKENISQHSKVIIELTADKIDSQISNYDNITLKLITTPEIGRLLTEKPENQFERMGMQRELESYVRPIIGEIDTRNIISVVFATKNGRYVVGHDNPDSYYDFEPAFVNGVNNGKGSPIWFKAEPFKINQKKIDAFRVGRNIKNGAFQNIGFVYLVINSRWLESIVLNQMNPELQIEVLDLNEQNVLNSQLSSAEYDAVTTVHTNKNDWSIKASYNLNELYKEANRMSSFSKGLIAFCTIIGLIVTYILVLDLIMPIRKLRINMNQGIKGVKPEEMIKFKGAKEICELNDLFISVMYEIYNLIEKEKLNEKVKRQIELKLLQKQISPHFLYNTLNTIRWMAIIKKQNHIKEVIDSLTHLLTYSLRNTDELVLIESELSILEDYVKIQRVRYQDFEFTIKKETEIGHLQILKFLLQPLIENALIHGFSNFEGLGRIILTISSKDNMLYIHVFDNGVGIPNERLIYIQELLNGKTKDQHIGLRSIHERIQASYGHEFGLSVSSEKNVGTTMELRLPIIQN